MKFPELDGCVSKTSTENAGNLVRHQPPGTNFEYG